ncbi:MAG: GNAT family N-acetyltransferase [Erysipelotrichaceae bacterium]|nr:GNAT family N-acetyltransferase [Erysipelotrichaceae bacterium]
MNIEIISAYDHLDDVRKLFIEYQTSLGIDLCFQNYDEELKSLPGKYALPDGRLYMITIDEEIAGCIALRRFDKTRCEMKRLYIRPQYRGHHCGQLLVEKIIQEAKIIGYEEMVLDTLSSLKSAVSLYQRNGFIEVSPYYDNPLQNVLYFKLKL